MKQFFIVRNHNNFVDDFQTFNKIQKKTTKEIHYFIIGWNDVNTKDYIHKVLSEDGERIDENKVLEQFDYEKADNKAVP